MCDASEVISVHWWDILKEFNIYSIAFRLLLAMIFGGIIGIERGSKRRAAGFRTYMLVCVSSALVMITNQYISQSYPSDPARLGAQVISGIGFLGAGTIIVTSYNQVKGLTTAAGLWASACLGLAIGMGFYEGAIIASVLILLIIAGLHRVDNLLVSHSRNMELYVEFSDGGQLSNLISFARGNAIVVLHMEFTHPKFNKGEHSAALLSMRLPKRFNHHDIVEELAKVEGVFYIEEV
jgi:putative Mg2+ transporter-C (MgtC) family protein